MEIEGGIVLSSNEQQRFEIVRQVEENKLDKETACQQLEVSQRTLYRYINGYRKKGLLFLKHGNRGKKPSNSHPYEVKAAVIKVMREVLFDFNMTHGREIIEDKFGLTIPRETFRRWCHAGNIVKHRRKRRKKTMSKEPVSPMKG